MKKKIFLSVIIVLLMLSVVPGCGAAKTVSDEYFTYTLLDDGTYSIAAKDKTNLPEELIIPELFNGKPVSKIAKDGFSRCSQLRRVTLSKRITSVGVQGFAFCSNLGAVDIPETVEGFGNGAFAECERLTAFHYEGTKDEWKNILKASNWDVHSEGYSVLCSDGNIN